MENVRKHLTKRQHQYNPNSLDCKEPYAPHYSWAQLTAPQQYERFKILDEIIVELIPSNSSCPQSFDILEIVHQFKIFEIEICSSIYILISNR